MVKEVFPMTTPRLFGENQQNGGSQQDTVWQTQQWPGDAML